MSVDQPYIRYLEQPDGAGFRYFSLPALAEQGFTGIQRLPHVIRLLLESAMRNCDGNRVLEQHIRALAAWHPGAHRDQEIPFVVSRVLLQDSTGLALLTDLAAMRSQAQRRGADPKAIEPKVPVHLVVDHSVQTVFVEGAEAVGNNQKLEIINNRERYELLKWGAQAFETFTVIPPGKGICHQINLEYLAQGVVIDDGLIFPDTLVGTDSHTTTINGIGILGWGVGGIEAEAAMLGQPLNMLMPDVVGVCLTGALSPGVTATDAVLFITQFLRKARVVGNLLEFFGEGTTSLSATDRSTIANMAPEFGATCAYFPVDENTLAYYRQTGRTERQISLIRGYYSEQGLWGAPAPGSIEYSRLLNLDLSAIRAGVSGPKRPQDHLDLGEVPERFVSLLLEDAAIGGYGKSASQLSRRFALNTFSPTVPTRLHDTTIGHGDVLVAAITSCTNTSNPELMLAAGLLARNAVARGLAVKPKVKTLFTPGSRVVEYLLSSVGLAEPLSQLGFSITAFGCGACVGNIGGLEPVIENLVNSRDLVCCAVLSGNRNFEARIHGTLRANFLASPPLVVAFALAGTTMIDLSTQALGNDQKGQPVFLADLWPTDQEIKALAQQAVAPAVYRRLYAEVTQGSEQWNAIEAGAGLVYDWPESTYAAEPDYFSSPGNTINAIRGARALAIFGNSVTTDHISPAGAIAPDSPAGQWLTARGVAPQDFNTYGARRGHFEVMVRGTFANVRLKNLLLPLRPDGGMDEGAFTRLQPIGERMSIFDASRRYLAANVPALIFAGEEYGTGSSRDWAAKGTRLLGVRAVIARSFERIHRSNLIGMGVLPLQFEATDSAQSLQLDGSESFDILGMDGCVQPRQKLTLVVHRSDGRHVEIPVLARIDTPAEAAYFIAGGILPYVLNRLIEPRASGVDLK
ncbi:aconitate hydratase AcnA [Pseudomonas sp. MD195_PC81_125]|uniref:aconitate hydratase AcnA n=1 Tax=Pseudomonas sp. MD195_PC81_125 TaxID=2741560 RepID=UPI0015F8DC4E|nr:aconitate hydratase AcnA [Pseudomonas sp. MD195_PC81_125]MBA5979053.1 aconitate hydratase AcnA [Pseudomonas sp. MD195_PC81_125]